MGSGSGRRAVAWASAFSLAVWSLLRLGRLDWMRVDWSDPAAWLAVAETEVALAALGWVAGLALLAWVGVSTIGYLVFRLLGVESDSVRWLSIGPFRRAVEALLASYLMLGTVTPVGAMTDPGPPPPSPAGAAVDPAYIPVPAGPGASSPESEKVTGDDTSGQVAVVSAGDHLWKLAAERLTEALGRSPTDAEVAPYWMDVVEANRARIRSGDPDLIFPGEEIVLPPLRRGS